MSKVFNSEDEAKGYAVDRTARHINLTQAQNRIADCEKNISQALGDEDRAYWVEEKEKLETYISSKDFQEDKIARGIDELIIELIEWRASIYAFQSVDTKQTPFNESGFYAQWVSGGIYAVMSIIGKLKSADTRDNSLYNLWHDVSIYVPNTYLCNQAEVDEITKKLNRKTGHFTNDNSKAVLYRNKVVSHNEALPKVEWTEVDTDIKLLCRIWSIITMWSSFGLIEPFRDSEIAFAGLESAFDRNEILQLQEMRQQYLDILKEWCTQSIVDGSKVSERVPFGKLQVSVKATVLSDAGDILISMYWSKPSAFRRTASARNKGL